MYNKIQSYLKENGINDKTLKDLSENHGIEASFDEEIDTHLINFNYNQINASKNDPLVTECRGIVINKKDLSIQSKSFNRFFNYGEVESNIDFNNCHVEEKIDGSLIRIAFDNEDNTWKFGSRGTVNARGVYTNDEYDNIPYCKLICDALGIYTEDIIYHASMSKDNDGNTKSLDVNIYLEYRKRFHDFMEKNIPEMFDKNTMTIVCELVSPYIASTTKYDKTKLYILSIIDCHNVEYKNIFDLFLAIKDNFNKNIFNNPKKYFLNNLNDIKNLLSELNKDSNTVNEGFVVVDKNTMERVKFKTDLYLRMHYYISNGATPKRLTKIYLEGEQDEFLTYYPEYKTIFSNFKRNEKNEIYSIENLYLIIKSLINSGIEMKEIASKYKNNPHFKEVVNAVKKNKDIDSNQIFNNYNLKKKIEFLIK